MGKAQEGSGCKPVWRSRRRQNKDAIERLAMRVPATLKEKYTRAAELRGETFIGWAKHVLDEAAERQIREHEFTEMALADRIAFMESVLSPPKPTQSALKAAKRYKQIFGL